MTPLASALINNLMTMTKRTRIIIPIFCAIANIAMAQIETSDCLQNVLFGETSDSLFSKVKIDAQCNNADSSFISIGYFKTAASFYSTFQFDTLPFGALNSINGITPLLFTYIPPAYPLMIYNADNFSILGSVSSNYYPGLMNKDSGCLGVSMGNDKMNFYVGGIIKKYGFYGGLLRQLGVNGHFTYNLSYPWSFTAFAYYYGRNRMPIMPDGRPMPPSMLGYYEVSRFGAYINYRPSERFGVQVGAQVVERMGGRNHYEVEPIATPYINIGRGKKKIGIGLPVGQILNGLLGR